MKVAILDDDKNAIETIYQLILKYSNISGLDIDKYQDANYFLASDKTYDLLFLDIDMPKINGLEVAKELANQKTIIIYITNIAGFMPVAFGINVIGFLLKDDLEEKFKPVMSKAIKRIKQQQTIILIKNNDVYRYDPSMIKYIEYIDRELIIHLTNKKDYLGYLTLKEVLERLPEQFIPINRYQIVNIDAIKDFRNYIISFNQGDELLKVSRRKGKLVFQAILKTIE
ncbi:MAG: LytR/AlgR family response regulator transcription factor [Thomasclavelia sp.]